jgi:hypothetical protein
MLIADHSRVSSMQSSLHRADGIRVDISSALVPTEQADRAAVALATSSEFHMYLPTVRAFQDEDDDYRNHDNDPCRERVTRMSSEAGLMCRCACIIPSSCCSRG